MEYSEDEFQFGPFADLFYVVGTLDRFFDNDNNRAHVEALLELGIEEMTRLGFRVSARSTRDVLAMFRGEMPGSNLRDYIMIMRNSLMIELDETVFLPVDAFNARFYREPRRDWEEVIGRFADTVKDRGWVTAQRIALI